MAARWSPLSPSLFTRCVLHVYQVHKDEDSHQHLHLQLSPRWRARHHHYALPEHGLPVEYLALRRGGVQGLHLHRLLQHVHQHLHSHHDERGPLCGCVPPGESPGLPHSHQSEDDQRVHLDPVLGCGHTSFRSWWHPDEEWWGSAFILIILSGKVFQANFKVDETQLICQ